jgi:hypothetical protein
LAVLLAVAPIPPRLVERWYSSGLYTFLQPALTVASNFSPVALFDPLVGAVIIAIAALGARDVSRLGRRRGGLRAAGRVMTWGAALYLVFLVAWGFNYRRLPMTERLPFDERAITSDAAARLADVAVDRLNALHARAHGEGWLPATTIDPALAGAFDRVMPELGGGERVAVGRPKRSLFDWYFTRAGVSGMIDPYLLETLVASDLLPFERPFVVAHEWSHLAGLADEGEANAAGWLVCLRGTAGHQYSGWLFMYGELSGVLPARAALGARLAAGPRADLRAIRERVARHVNPTISNAGWRVYDSYLKANRVEAGTASYGQVVRLALGLRNAQRARSNE